MVTTNVDPYKKTSNRNALIIGVLVLTIIVLALIIVFVLVVQPRFNAYVVQKQFDAQQMVVASLISSLNTQGYVTITDANGQTIVLAPVQQPPA